MFGGVKREVDAAVGLGGPFMIAVWAGRGRTGPDGVGGDYDGDEADRVRG